MSFDIGDRIKATATFTDDDGAAANPTTTTFIVRKPDGTETSYIVGTDAEATNPTTGTAKLLLTVDQAGVWTCRVEGTGTVVAADEALFAVDRTVLA